MFYGNPCKRQEPILVAFINFNFSMDKWSHEQQSVEWNYLSIPQLQLLKFGKG